MGDNDANMTQFGGTVKNPTLAGRSEGTPSLHKALHCAGLFFRPRSVGFFVSVCHLTMLGSVHRVRFTSFLTMIVLRKVGGLCIVRILRRIMKGFGHDSSQKGGRTRSQPTDLTMLGLLWVLPRKSTLSN